jgi:hypothetical protein
LRRIVEWAKALDREKLANVSSDVTGALPTLYALLPFDNVGLATISKVAEGPSVWLALSVWKRKCPAALAELSRLVELKDGHGQAIRRSDQAFLDVLTRAYRQAAQGASEAE